MDGYNDIVEARRFIYEQMVKLSKGEISLDVAIAQGKLAHQLMEGYRIQVKAMEIINSSEHNIPKRTIKELR